MIAIKTLLIDPFEATCASKYNSRGRACSKGCSCWLLSADVSRASRKFASSNRPASLSLQFSNTSRVVVVDGCLCYTAPQRTRLLIRISRTDTRKLSLSLVIFLFEPWWRSETYLVHFLGTSITAALQGKFWSQVRQKFNLRVSSEC